MIYLQPITQDNFDRIIQLDIASEYLKSTAWQLALSYVFPTKVPLAVYNDSQLIGFISYELDYEPQKAYDILVFVISKEYRRQHLGKDTLYTLLRYFKEQGETNLITLNVHPNNRSAISFYESCGFTKTEKKFHDEIIMSRLL